MNDKDGEMEMEQSSVEQRLRHGVICKATPTVQRSEPGGWAAVEGGHFRCYANRNPYWLAPHLNWNATGAPSLFATLSL